MDCIGSFSAAGASQCNLCQSLVAGVSPTVAVPYYFWTSPQGASSSAQCICQKGYTGTNCEFSLCPYVLPGGSLGSLLLQADTKIRQFSAAPSAIESVSVESYLFNLIQVGVDMNGDGNITTSEMLTALRNRLIFSSGMTQLPLWCVTADVWSYCYEGIVEVKAIYTQALANFRATGYFDGSGTEVAVGFSSVTAMTATYPVPSWSLDTCRAYDHSIHPSATIIIQWSIAKNPNVKRVCGYINGYFDSDFSTTPILSGSQTSFIDSVPANSSYLNKRVYCVAVEYCSWGSILFDHACFTDTTHTKIAPFVVSYVCSVGLIYDGTPIDLTPQLGKHGVTFSFIDTSSSESRFDIFVGELGSDDSTKTNVVTIPTGLSGCGRTANPISFTDQISAMSVGQIMEYAISATQSPDGISTVLVPTEMFKFPYRIPFLVSIDGDVKFRGGGGVEYVNVAFCHLDKATKLPDPNTQYCPVVTFITDLFGHFTGEIRVSDP